MTLLYVNIWDKLVQFLLPTGLWSVLQVYWSMHRPVELFWSVLCWMIPHQVTQGHQTQQASSDIAVVALATTLDEAIYLSHNRESKTKQNGLFNNQQISVSLRLDLTEESQWEQISIVAVQSTNDNGVLWCGSVSEEDKLNKSGKKPSFDYATALTPRVQTKEGQNKDETVKPQASYLVITEFILIIACQ